MSLDTISVGVPTTRFRSCDTIDNSVEQEPLFRFDLSNYFNVCRFQRERKSFKNFVLADVVSLLDILPVVGSLYNVCALTDICLRCDSWFEEEIFYAHVVALLLHCVQFGFLLIKNIKVKLPAYYPLFPVSIIFAMILWDGAADFTGYIYSLHWLQMLFLVAMVTFSGRFLLPLFGCLLLLSSFFILHGTCINEYPQNHQISMSMIVFICIASHGFAAHFSLENEYLMNFLESLRFSKYEKIVAEEQAVKNRIMNAAFPTYIAEEITQAFDANTIGTFRKMYITKNDNVTIVFADIVGFTSISSFYSAERLVNMLNEIFISFDRIADKYHQLRLKILGDCYYCICGVPEPQTDHAYLSVCMGFGIIDAIRKISTKVSMRVGIHTGSVLSGVIGLSQWQFDVLGQDVKIANLMESSGVAGKVHITHVTRALLSDDYVITPSKAGQKVEFLQRAGIRTFFIAQAHNQQAESAEDEDISHLDNERHTCEIRDLCDATTDETDWYPLTLGFKNIDMENLFRSRRQFLPLQPYSYVFVLMIFFVNNFPCTFICWKSILPVSLGSIILLFNIVTMAQGMDGLTEKSSGMYLTENIFILISGIVLLIICSDAETWISHCEVAPVANGTVIDTKGNWTAPVLLSLSDYVLVQFLLLIIGVNEALTLSHTIRCVITVAFVLTFLSLLTYLHPHSNYLHTVRDMIIPVITIISLSIVIVLMDRKIETLKRKTFLQRNKTVRNHAKLRKLRKKNKKILYNIILPDIARDLLSKHDQTYLHSQTHDDVGVMFAACPHFEEFYTENCNYEDGLGCLRFLNEIISDYDELLQEPEFANLCKIKTIGATYMVASGLRKHLDYMSTEESGRCKRWEHLGVLLKFALKLMDVIEDISRESFTNFQLRIGINHGPVIAGVIGAHRPHYDIFGNTVNVASRMESTGVIGEIQVLKGTAQTLQRFDYNFKLRGSIEVKGKGRLVTYFLSRTDNPDASSH